MESIGKQHNFSKEEVFDTEDYKREALEKIILVRGEMLGKGKTAEVFFLDEVKNTNLCYKVITSNTMESQYGSKIDFPKFNPVTTEADFLSRLGNSSEQVKIPKPIVTWEGTSESLGEYQVLVMERLDAVSLQDILWQVEKKPEAFNSESFFIVLSDYIERMNKEYGVYHRDLSASNILVHRVTGQPCVIDFGDAYLAFGDNDDPYNSRSIISDTARLRELKRYCVNM